MKIKLFLLFLAVKLAGISAGANESKLAGADNGFAFKLLREVSAAEPGKNAFISPYSAATALQMVAGGAVGQTKTEMDGLLGTAGLSNEAVGQANHEIAASLNTGNTNVILTTVNAVWYQRDFAVDTNFVIRTKAAFGATFDPLDFKNPNSVGIINQWASDQTHGRIDHLADGLDPESTRLFLANAVYFKGKWSDPFDVSGTQNHPFHLRGGGEVQVPMMSKERTFSHRKGTGYEAVRLPYQDENLGMYVFLPDTNSSPEKLLDILNGDRWKRVTKPGFKDELGVLLLPKFKFDYTVLLNDPLKKLGMARAFDSEKADFGGIGKELYISTVLQKAFVEVKEEGTEAAAVTEIAVQAEGIEMSPPEEFHMTVDRPFVFLIEDNKTGVILFMGVVYEPKE